MQYGIQRRTICLIPPTPDDLAWMFDEFEKKEVWDMFGFPGPSKKLMQERHAKGNVVVGIIKRVEGERRIGFAVSFPPTDLLPWEYSVVIPDPKDRDLYSAIHASDATAHYMFDHCRIEECAWRVREDNGPSLALVRKMGFRPYTAYEVNGVRYKFFRMNKDRWEARYQKLEEWDDGEEVFQTLSDPPYRPTSSCRDDAPEEVPPPA